MTQEDLKGRWEGVLSIEEKKLLSTLAGSGRILNFTFFKPSVGIQKKVRK
jgi:hypothetical protein